MLRLTLSFSAIAACSAVVAAISGAAAADVGGYKDPAVVQESEFGLAGIRVGGVLVVKPTYEGSDEYEAVGFPYILPQFSGGPGFFSRIDARALDDVRFKLIERGGFVAGPLAGYNLGRDEDDGDLLDGMGDLDGGVVLGGFVGYGWQWLMFDVSYHHTLGDDGGALLRFGVEAEKPVSQRVTLTGRIGATYADDEYMQNYFGAPASSYNADAGFKDVHAQIGVEADLDAHWSAKASLRYSHLLGDAADSPIVETDDQFTGMFGLSYRFGVGY